MAAHWNGVWGLGTWVETDTTTVGRRMAVLREHQELIGHIKAQDAEMAAATVARHVEGSGRHILEQMRAAGSRRVEFA